MSRVAADMTMGGSHSDETYYSDPIDINYADAKSPAATAGAAKAGGGAGTAALIALQLYSQAKKAQFADKQARYKAHLDQRNAMSNALDSLIGTTRNLRL